MAVFMLNICKFNDCGIVFPSLADLILHIEDTHIDYDPAVIEQKEQQQPQCLPLSYVLKFYSNTTRRESQIVDIKRRLIQHASKSSVQNYSSTVSEQDDDDPVTESENSNESWTTSEEFSSEYILKYGSRITSPSSVASSDKPFVCPVPGCKKRYKNINGIKYHSKNGHKKDGKIRKGYKCHCGKSYKTAQGLKNHTNVQHAYSQSEVQTTDLDTGFRAKQIQGAMNIDPKAKLKSVVESNKKLLAAKAQQSQRVIGMDGCLESELGILTPATSPESSPSFSNLPLNTLSNSYDYQLNSTHCDTN